jgi:hypothetical protein
LQGFLSDISDKNPFFMFLSLLLTRATEPKIVCGKVIDISDNQPLHSVMVYTKRDTTWTNLDGSFQIPVGDDGYFIQGLGFKALNNKFPQNGEIVQLEPLAPSRVKIKKK